MVRPKAGIIFTGKNLSTIGLALAGAELPQEKKMKTRRWRQTCYFFYVSQWLQRAKIRKQLLTMKSVRGQTRRLLLLGGEYFICCQTTSGVLITPGC